MDAEGIYHSDTSCNFLIPYSTLPWNEGLWLFCILS